MISINGKTESAYSANFIHWEVSSPEPRTEIVEVPLRDGFVDLARQLSGSIFYGTRTITIGLELRGLRSTWWNNYSLLLNEIHGQSVEVIRDDDPDWYWTGVASVGALEDHGASAGVTIEVTAQPFKRSVLTEVLYNQTAISGDLLVSYDNDYMRAYPIFTPSAAGMTVTMGDESWTLPLGRSTAYGLFLIEGTSEFTIHGSGTITVEIEGGSL